MKDGCTLYAPVKEQFLVLIEYINILEKQNAPDKAPEILVLIDFIEKVTHECEVYLRYNYILNKV